MFFKRKKELENRREYPRVNFLQASFCKNMDEHIEDELYNCFLKNISKNGISFYLKDKTLKVSDNVQILYRIGSKIRNDFLSIKNESKFLNDWRFGCQFHEPDQIRDLQIQEYISKN